MIFLRPVALGICHKEKLSSFDCGNMSMNMWLEEHALINQQTGASKTYLVLTEDQELAGFFSVRVGIIGHSVLSAAFRRNMPDPLPVLLLGRLAVNKKYQHQGLAKAMVNETIRLGMKVAEMASCWAVTVEPLTDELCDFYAKLGFRRTRAQRPLLFYRLRDNCGSILSE